MTDHARTKVLLVAVLLAAPPLVRVARAEAQKGPKAVLLSLTFENIDPAEQARIREKLVPELRVVPNVAAANPREPPLTGLDDRARIYWGKQYGADLLVEGAVWYVKASDKNLPEYNATLKLFDVRGGASLGKPEDEKCSNCKLEQFLERLSKLVQELYALQKIPLVGRLVVRVNPPSLFGANIKIDERPMGKLPFDETLFVGRHEISLEAEGYEIGTASVMLKDGETTDVMLKLMPIDPSAFPSPVEGSEHNIAAVMALTGAASGAGNLPVVEKRSPALKIVGAAGLVAGAVLVGIGAYGLSLNGKPTCTLVGEQTQCPNLYATNTAGGAMVGVGAAVMVVGAVALLVDYRAGAEASRRSRESAMQPLVWMGPEGMGAGLMGRF